MIKHDSRWCWRCQRRVMATNSGINHGLHAVLTVATCGLWLPVYALVIFAGNFRCRRCGTKV